MYIFPKISEDVPRKRKPSVLFVLQGEHHLMLYENVFRYCTQFQWYCLLPSLPKAKEDDELKRLNASYGVRFFSDSFAALAHFAQIDAVINTWAVPHRKHLPYLRYTALAYELGLPVFELQHGLFQIGLTYSEDSAVIGQRTGAATALFDAENFSSNVLLWSGLQGVGYPRAMPDDDRDEEPAAGRHRVTFITNHHWAVLTEAERRNCYTMMGDAIIGLPGVEFIILPHGGELKIKPFEEMIARLESLKAGNFRVETSRKNGVYDRLLRNSNLVVGSVSTTILDCEYCGVPTVVFRNPSQDRLTEMFESAVLVDSSKALIAIINDVLYRNYRPTLVTGFADPFRPDILAGRLEAAIRESPPRSREETVVAITRYLGMSASAVTGLA